LNRIVIENKTVFLTAVIILFLSFSTFSQGILINPYFKEINICLEHEKPCAYKGWYPVGEAVFPRKLQKKGFVLNFVPFPDMESPNRTGVVGCLNRPEFSNSKLDLKFEIIEPRKFNLGIALLKEFPFESNRDRTILDSINFNFYKIDGKRKNVLEIDCKDTTLFIVLVVLDSTNATSILFKSIDLYSKLPTSINEFALYQERIKFILNDRRRHFFINTYLENRSIINLK
jgi:hypothetical protein